LVCTFNKVKTLEQGNPENMQKVNTLSGTPCATT